MRWSELTSPVGALGVAADDAAVRVVSFDGPQGPPAPVPGPLLADAVAQLRAYFDGRLTRFALPLLPHRGSDFERAVWAAIAAIPYGATRTYGEIARDIGDPTAARAVGVACNRNHLPIVIPCHRVVGAGAKLTGFGGGLPRKRHLLELEARVALVRELGGGTPP